MGFGASSVRPPSRVPRPPQKSTTFMATTLAARETRGITLPGRAAARKGVPIRPRNVTGKRRAGIGPRDSPVGEGALARDLRSLLDDVRLARGSERRGAATR